MPTRVHSRSFRSATDDRMSALAEVRQYTIGGLHDWEGVWERDSQSGRFPVKIIFTKLKKKVKSELILTLIKAASS